MMLRRVEKTLFLCQFNSLNETLHALNLSIRELLSTLRNLLFKQELSITLGITLFERKIFLQKYHEKIKVNVIFPRKAIFLRIVLMNA